MMVRSKENIKSCLLISLGLILHIAAFAAPLLNVKSFGARGDGITDDTKAIQKAIDAADPMVGTTIYFPSGVYSIAGYTTTTNYLENYSLLMHSNIDFRGEGETSVVRIGDHMYDKADINANAHIFYGNGLSNVSFGNIRIEMNGQNNLVPKDFIKNYTAIFIDRGHKVSFNHITISNCAGCNMIAIKGAGSGLSISDCNFYNGGNYVGSETPNSNQFDFSFIYSEWDSSNISNNHIEQQNPGIALGNYTGGIELHASYSMAVGNFIRGCLPGVYIASTQGIQKKVCIEDNVLEDCVKGVSFWVHAPITDVLIENNRINLTAFRVPKADNIVTGIQVPNGNVTRYDTANANAAIISNLVINKNSITYIKGPAPAIVAGVSVHSLHNSRITGNILSGINYAGIAIAGSKWGTSDLVISGNSFQNFVPANDMITGFLVITDTYTKSNQYGSGLQNIIIEKNTGNVADGKANEKFYTGFVALPGYMLNNIRFSNNRFSASLAGIIKTNTD